MGRYIDLPTLFVDFLKPAKMSFDVKGGGIDSGRNGLGESISIEMTGGGMMVASYQSCFAQSPEEHEYGNFVAARMNGSFRFINVPILSDWMGPFPTTNGIPQPTISGIPHSNGSKFSDASGYSQATVYGTVTEDAALNAGTLKMRLFGAVRKLRWSDWFSIYHPTKGWRAYRYWEVDDIDETVPDSPIYTVSIVPALREGVTAGDRVELVRPRCVMKFPTGFTLPWEVEGFWRSNPTIQFVEAF